MSILIGDARVRALVRNGATPKDLYTPIQKYIQVKHTDSSASWASKLVVEMQPPLFLTDEQVMEIVQIIKTTKP